MNLVFINAKGKQQYIHGNSVAYYTEHNPDFISNIVMGNRPLGVGAYERNVDFSPNYNLIEILEDVKFGVSSNSILDILEQKVIAHQKKEGQLFMLMGLSNTSNSSYDKHLENIKILNEILKTKKNSEFGKAAAALTGSNIKIATMKGGTKGFQQQIEKQNSDNEINKIKNSFIKGVLNTFNSKAVNSINTKKKIVADDFRREIRKEELNVVSDLNYVSYVNGQLLSNFNIRTSDEFNNGIMDPNFTKNLITITVEYFKNYFKLFSIKWTSIKPKISQYVKEIITENPSLTNTLSKEFTRENVVQLFSKLYLKLTVNDLVNIDNSLVGTKVDKKFLSSINAQREINQYGENSVLIFDKNNPSKVISKISIGAGGQINKINTNRKISFSLSDENKLYELGIPDIDLFKFLSIHLPMANIFNFEKIFEELIFFYLLNFSNFDNFLHIDDDIGNFILVGKDIIPASLVLKNILNYLKSYIEKDSFNRNSPISVNYKNSISSDDFRKVDWETYPDKKNLKFENNSKILNQVKIDLNFNLKMNKIMSNLKKIL